MAPGKPATDHQPARATRRVKLGPLSLPMASGGMRGVHPIRRSGAMSEWWSLQAAGTRIGHYALMSRSVGSSRMEAYSDGVFSIASTLLVLDIALRPPGSPLEQLGHEWPGYLGYVVSFLTISAAW